MTKDKLLPLTQQHQIITLVYFLCFLSHLLELILEPSVWLSRFNTFTLVAGMVIMICMVILREREGEDELSKQNSLKADSFVLRAITIIILCIPLLASTLDVFVKGIPALDFVLVKTDSLSLSNGTLYLTLFWFLGFSRNAAFLVFERLGKN